MHNALSMLWISTRPQISFSLLEALSIPFLLGWDITKIVNRKMSRLHHLDNRKKLQEHCAGSLPLWAIKVVVSHFRDCFLCTSSLFTAATTVDRIVGDYDLWPNLATTIVAPSLKIDKFSSFQIRLFCPIFECWTLYYVSILCVGVTVFVTRRTKMNGSVCGRLHMWGNLL